MVKKNLIENKRFIRKFVEDNFFRNINIFEESCWFVWRSFWRWGDWCKILISRRGGGERRGRSRYFWSVRFCWFGLVGIGNSWAWSIISLFCCFFFVVCKYCKLYVLKFFYFYCNSSFVYLILIFLSNVKFSNRRVNFRINIGKGKVLNIF